MCIRDSYTHVVDSLHIYDHHFEEAATIAHNDLYMVLGADHPPFVPYSLPTLHNMEKDIRVGGNTSIAMMLPTCWQVAMGLFIAHRHYREHEDEKAMRMLKNVSVGDPIFGAAQARFYYTNRWSKSQEQTVMLSDMFESDVFNWITGYQPDA